MNSGMLITRMEGVYGGTGHFPVVRRDDTCGVLKLYAELDYASWEIRIALNTGQSSITSTTTSDQSQKVSPIAPSASYFDGRPFELPRPLGVRAIPERIRFKHPSHPGVACEIQIYEDDPLP